MALLKTDDARPSIYICQFATGFSKNLVPLAAGRIYSLLKNDPEIMAHYRLEDILFLREDPTAIVRRMRRPAIVAFSTYMWNWEMSLSVARLVHEAFPQALTVFGGPSVPNPEERRKWFFDQYDGRGILCHSDEVPIVDIARALLRGGERDLQIVDGISYSTGNEHGYASTRPRPFVPDLAAIPSPFLDGTFDELYRQHRDRFSGVIWETNRGCPYSCTFCDWGSAIGQRVRSFDLDLLREELDWMGRTGIPYIMCADANFGIKKRDHEIAELVVRAREKYGDPRFLSVSWMKNSSTRVLEIARTLRDGGIGFRVGLSLQSTNEAALKSVKRSNIRLSTYRELKEAFSREDMPTFTEMILGLPDETYESFLTGIEEMLTNSLDDHVYMYLLSILENTELALPEQVLMHGIETRRVPFGFYRTAGTGKVSEEFEDVVIATKTMPHAQWRATYRVGFFSLALYDHRLCFVPLVYLKNEHGARATDFAAFALAQAASGDYPILALISRYLEARIEGIVRDSRDHLKVVPGFDEDHWTASEAVYLIALARKEEFLDEMEGVFRAYVASQGLPVPDMILSDLMNTQRHFLAHWQGPPSHTLTLRFDVPEYVEQLSRGQRVPIVAAEYAYEVSDMLPSHGARDVFLKRYMDVRGSRVFNAMSAVRNGEMVTYFAPNITPAVVES